MRIHIIGLGTIGSAILQRLRSNSQNHQIHFVDRKLAKTRLSRKFKVKADYALKHLAKADILIVSVKPQDLGEVAKGVKGKLTQKTIILSVAAGVSLKRLKKLFSHGKIVRIMPNLGMVVGQGVAVWAASKKLSRSEKSKINGLLNEFTEAYEINERKIDAVGAISGSGPAYFFYLAGSIEKQARKMGLSKTLSRALVEKTFLAAASLQGRVSYSKLIKQVASKKGITEEALKIFTKNKLDKIIASAILRAEKRSKELNQ